MGAKNTTAQGATYYKLKESERPDESKGQFRFFKQEKQGDKWTDGEGFNTIEGVVTDVKTKDFEWQGEKKQSLEVTIDDHGEKLVISMGLGSSASGTILNTLAGDNGFDLNFFCGKAKENKGKWYPSLYINKLGQMSRDDAKTQWKYSPDQIPKIVVTVDAEGNKIKKGKVASDKFWLGVVSDINGKLLQKNINQPSEAAMDVSVDNNASDDLPF